MWVRMAERHTESGTCCEVSGTLKVSPQLMTRRSWEDSALVQQLSAATCNDYLKVFAPVVKAFFLLQGVMVGPPRFM